MRDDIALGDPAIGRERRRRLDRLAEERIGNAVRRRAFDRGVRLERAFHLTAEHVLAADDDDVLDAIDDAEPPVRVHRRRVARAEPTPAESFGGVEVRVDGSQYPSNSAEPRTRTSPISSPSCATETSSKPVDASVEVVAEVSSLGVDSSSSSRVSVLRATSTSIAASSSAATRPARAKSSALSSTDVLLAMASSKGRRRLVHTRPPISVMP